MFKFTKKNIWISGFSSNSQKQQVTIVNGQSRLFLPSAISSVSNSLQNLGGGGNPGASAGSGNFLWTIFYTS